MDSLWEAIKMSFSGIFNWGTLVGLFVGVLAYGLFSAIATFLENKEYTMRLFASLQLQIGMIGNKATKKIASWLWTEIMNLDYERRCQLAIDPPNDEEQVWLILQLPYLAYRKKRIAHTCRVIASIPGISPKVAKAAQLCMDKIKHCQ